jgi:hypothetical protein
VEINSNDQGASGPACGAVTGNTIRNLRTGIFLAYGREIVMSGNVVQTIQKTGFNVGQGAKTGLMIVHNVIRDVGRLGNEAGGPYYGINLAGAKMAVVTGNIVTSDGPKLPLHCLRIDRSCSRVQVRDNLLDGASGAALANEATGPSA